MPKTTAPRFAAEHISGPVFKQRLHVKTFQSSAERDAWLNARYDNDWNVSDRGLGAGIYVFLGGAWRNVKTVDPSALAHC